LQYMSELTYIHELRFMRLSVVSVQPSVGYRLRTMTYEGGVGPQAHQGTITAHPI